MAIKTLKDFDLKNKVVLLRVDLNSPVKNGKVIDNDRISESANSIKAIKKKGAKVVVLAHQGRKGDEDFTSLKQHSKLLNKYTKIKFIEDIYGKKFKKEFLKLKNGEALLLENVRYEDAEKNNDEKSEYVKTLSSVCDVYINDAFSVSHREQASITAFPKVMKKCGIGINLEKELNALKKVKIKNVLYILAGSKAEENMKFMQEGKKIIAGGKFAQMFMMAKGFHFGKHEKFLDKEGVSKLKDFNKIKVTVPIDFAVKEKNKRKEIGLHRFPNEYEIFDIGEKTIELFKKEIMKAKAIFMKGPLGYIEEKQFQKGTEEIMKAIVKSRAFSVLGGGHLSTALKQLGLDKKKFGHISLSGGALATYMAGEKLPGLEVLK